LLTQSLICLKILPIFWGVCRISSAAELSAKKRNAEVAGDGVPMLVNISAMAK
jgi:hypothetical protein